MNVASLDRAFEAATRAVGAQQASRDVFDVLATRHAEPQRHYHTLEHIAACLAVLDDVRAAAERPNELTLALFFHDAVYDPQRGDNEQESAELARRELSRLGIDAGVTERVAALVRATEGHDAESGDAALMVDVDLSILGAPDEAYDRYADAVRREYAHVSDADFSAGRAAFLRGLLARSVLFATPALAHLEPQARSNLARELASRSRT